LDLRDYQRDAQLAVENDWDRGVRGSLIVLPTGTGKTVVGSNIIRDRNVKTLVIVPNEEILDQFARSLQRVTGKTIGRIGGGRKDHRTEHCDIFVGIVNSLTRMRQFWRPDHFGLLVFDEAHHAPADSYKAIADRFLAAKMLGLTATPWRGDDKAMGQLFDSVSYRMDVLQAIDSGWLTPIESYVRTTRDMDFTKVGIQAGDFNKKQANVELTRDQVVKFIARETMEIAGDGQTVIFCSSIQQSIAVAQTLRHIGVNAAHVDGKTPKFMRRQLVDKYREARLQVLVNVGVIEEGVDVPGIEVVTLASPTRSQTKLLQRAGRGLRPVNPPQEDTADARCRTIAQSAKPVCKIVDIAGNMGTHIMRLSADILMPSDIADEVRRAALEIVENISGKIDWELVIKEAEKVAEKRLSILGPSQIDQQQRGAERIWVLNTKPCPYEVLGLPLIDSDAVSTVDSHGRNHQKALAWLTTPNDEQGNEKRVGPELSLKEVQHLTNREQVYLARVLYLRVGRESLPSYKMTRLLYLNGYKAADLNSQQAYRIFQRIKKNAWLRPAEDGPNEQFLARRQRKLTT